jgi:WD40 repeat protein
VLTGSSDKTAILWDAASGKPLQTFKGHTKFDFCPFSAAW